MSEPEVTPRKICVVTGGRADYGLLYWPMKELRASPCFALQVAATGTHLSPEFGATVAMIEDYLKGFSLLCVQKTLQAVHPSGGKYYDLLFQKCSSKLALQLG